MKFDIDKEKMTEWFERDLALWYATPGKTPDQEELWMHVQRLFQQSQQEPPTLAEIQARVEKIKRLAREVPFLVLAREDRGIGYQTSTS